MSCSTGCRSKGKQGVVEARKKLEEADLVFQDKLVGFLFSLGVFFIVSLFSKFILQEGLLEPQQWLAFARAFLVGNVFADAKKLVQAKVLFDERLESVVAKYGNQVVSKYVARQDGQQSVLQPSLACCLCSQLILHLKF